MTTREQYRSRWQQLESEIADLQKQMDEEYKKLPKVPHDSPEWLEVWDGYYNKICKPARAKIDQLSKDAKYCRIRSLDQFYCNRHLYSDVQPYEVIEVISDTRLKLRSMNAVQTEESVKRLKESFSPGGFLGHFDNDEQEWVCTSDDKGIIVDVRRRKDGHFYEVNDSIPYVLSVKPVKFKDFNF